MIWDKRKFGRRWMWMLQICRNPRHPEYEKYGARGIDCHWQPGEYQDYENYILTKLGDQPSSRHMLCRIDKQGDWAPGNLAWMLPQERSNSLTRQNVYASYRRRRQTLSKWSKELGIPYYSLRRRYAQGLQIKDIIKEFQNA